MKINSSIFEFVLRSKTVQIFFLKKMALCLTCKQEISNEAYIKFNCCGESIHYNLPCLFNRIWVRSNNQKCPNNLCDADFNAEERRKLEVIWPAINETIENIESFNK